MNTGDIRWKQRFDNFSRAFGLLRLAFDDDKYRELNQLEQEGAVQRFVYTWELAWKTVKDFLEYNGYILPEPAGPRNVIKEAAATFFEGAGIDGTIFVEMLDTRNELSHAYDFLEFRKALEKIHGKYMLQFENLHSFLSRMRHETTSKNPVSEGSAATGQAKNHEFSRFCTEDCDGGGSL
jgi:nucleotidyltransferase substrate binding protein (TIGR01987 family)